MKESEELADADVVGNSRRAGLLVGAAVTLVVVLLVVSFAARVVDERRSSLSDATEAVARALEQGVEQEVQKLRSTVGFFRGSQSVSPAQFATFSESIHGERSAGSAAVALKVEPAELADFERWFHDSYPGAELFGISAGERVPLAEGTTHYILSYLRSAPGVEWLIGYDLASQPHRQQVIEASLAADSAMTSEFVELVGQETGDDGFLIAVPLTDGSDEHAGVVISASDVSTLLEEWVPPSLRSSLILELGESPGTGGDGSWFHPMANVTVPVPGRTWTVTGRSAHPSPLLWRVFARGGVAALALGLGSAVLTSTLLTRRRLRRRVRRFETLSREREKTIEALQAFELMAVNATDVIARQDVDLTYRYLSPSVRATLGFEPEALVGRQPWAGFHPDDIPAVRASIERLVAGAEIEDVEHRVRHADGRWIWLHTISRAIRDRDGNVTEIQTASRDISDRVEQREALHRAREEAEAARAAAEEAAAEKARFLSNVSHEIRTPLSAVAGMSELLADSNLDGHQREYVDSIGVAATTVVSLINDLLDLSRAEEGRISIESVPFDLVATVSTVVRVLSAQAEASGVALRHEIAAGVPTSLVGDPHRVGQVLMNLTGNALKFTERGSVVISVAAESLSPEEARVRVSVDDTGIGIAADRLEAIFEPFEQAEESTARRFGGTGLGLGISRDLVRLMGGEIGAESEEGFGSTFWFELTLPIAEGNGPSQACVVAGRRADRAAIVAQLRFAGWNVTEMGAGRPIEKDLPGVVVCSLTDEASLAGVAGAVVADTAPERGNADRFRGLGAIGYVGLPVSSSELTDVIGRAVAGSFATRHDGTPPTVSLRVLAADDAPSNRLVLERILTRRGHSVVAVENGAEALEALARDNYDVVLLDGQMPVMSGPEATRRIRSSRRCHLPVIAVTGRVSDGERREALEAGADDWVAKPFDASRLCQAVETAAASRRRQVLDLETFCTQVGGLTDFAAELVDSVRREWNELSAALTPHALEVDPEAASTAAHRLKGVVSLVGAIEATDLASRLEGDAREGRMESAQAAAVELAAAMQELEAALVEAVDRLEAVPL